MKKLLLATVVFCGLMGGATAGPTAAEDNKWEADCRRGYITKTFSDHDSSMKIFHSDDGTTIRIEPEEFIDIENALHNLKLCDKFWQCVAERDGQE
jgi:hypothetical protein